MTESNEMSPSDHAPLKLWSNMIVDSAQELGMSWLRSLFVPICLTLIEYRHYRCRSAKPSNLSSKCNNIYSFQLMHAKMQKHAKIIELGTSDGIEDRPETRLDQSERKTSPSCKTRGLLVPKLGVMVNLSLVAPTSLRAPTHTWKLPKWVCSSLNKMLRERCPKW